MRDMAYGSGQIDGVRSRAYVRGQRIYLFVCLSDSTSNNPLFWWFRHFRSSYRLQRNSFGTSKWGVAPRVKMTVVQHRLIIKRKSWTAPLGCQPWRDTEIRNFLKAFIAQVIKISSLWSYMLASIHFTKWGEGAATSPQRDNNKLLQH